MMTQHQHFSSLPPDQEAAFVVYEQRQAEASKKGMTIGLVCGGIIGALALIIALAVTPDKDPHAEPDHGSKTQKAR